MDLAHLLLLAGASLTAGSLVGGWYFRGCAGKVVRALVLKTDGRFETDLLCVCRCKGEDVLVASSEFVVEDERAARAWVQRYPPDCAVRVHHRRDGTASVTWPGIDTSGTWVLLAVAGALVSSCSWAWTTGLDRWGGILAAVIGLVGFLYGSWLMGRLLRIRLGSDYDDGRIHYPRTRPLAIHLKRKSR